MSTKVVRVRFEPEYVTLIDKAAKERDMNRSEFVRLATEAAVSVAMKEVKPQ